MSLANTKVANETAGMQAGAAAPNPTEAVPPNEAAALPPELLSLIENAPPEVLQELLAAVQAEQGEGQVPGGDMDGLPPGSEDLAGAQPEYKTAYVKHAMEHYGFSKAESEAIYKRALELMASEPVTEEMVAEKVAHYNEFVRYGQQQYGLTHEQLDAIYAQNYK